MLSAVNLTLRCCHNIESSITSSMFKVLVSRLTDSRCPPGLVCLKFILTDSYALTSFFSWMLRVSANEDWFEYSEFECDIVFVDPPVTAEICTWTGVWKTTDDTAPLDKGEEAASMVLSSPFPRRDFLALRVARSVFAYSFPTQKSTARNEKESGRAAYKIISVIAAVDVSSARLTA